MAWLGSCPLQWLAIFALLPAASCFWNDGLPRDEGPAVGARSPPFSGRPGVQLLALRGAARGAAFQDEPEPPLQPFPPAPEGSEFRKEASLLRQQPTLATGVFGGAASSSFALQDGRQRDQLQAETEAGTDAEAESETDAEDVSESETEAESESDSEFESELVGASDAEFESQLEADGEAESDADSDSSLAVGKKKKKKKKKKKGKKKAKGEKGGKSCKGKKGKKKKKCLKALKAAEEAAKTDAAPAGPVNLPQAIEAAQNATDAAAALVFNLGKITKKTATDEDKEAAVLAGKAAELAAIAANQASKEVEWSEKIMVKLTADSKGILGVSGDAFRKAELAAEQSISTYNFAKTHLISSMIY